MPNPLLQSGPMSDIAAFQPGMWNGTFYSPAYVKSLVDNFTKYCTGQNPFYRPYLSIAHNDELSFGELSAAKVKPGNILALDAERVPLIVQEWIRGGQLRQPSIEIMEPKRDAKGNVVNGFRDQTGKIVEGPMIKCLTFLGADIPGVKGLPPLSTAKFRHFGGIVKRFSQMDRAGMIQFLTDAGVDMSTVTDAVPDTVLKAMVDFIQKSNQNPTPEQQQADTTQMAQNPVGTTAVAPAVAATPAGGAMSVPTGASQVVVKFAQTNPGVIEAITAGIMAPINATLAQIRQQNAADAAARAGRDKRDREAMVKTFCDRMVKDGRFTPAQRPGIERTLMKCDHLIVKKFSQGGKIVDVTEFDFECAELENTHPIIKKFGHQTTQPAITIPGATSGTGGTTDRKAAILAGARAAVGNTRPAAAAK